MVTINISRKKIKSCNLLSHIISLNRQTQEKTELKMEAPLVLIVLFLTCGTVAILSMYFKSKEKQMMIERGLAPDEMVKLYTKNHDFQSRNHFILLKLGVIAVTIGVFLGLGFLASWMFEDSEEFLAATIVIGVGIGFIAAHYAGTNEEKKKKEIN